VGEPGDKSILARLTTARAAGFARPAEPVTSKAEPPPGRRDVVCGCGAVVVPAARRALFAGMTLRCPGCGGASRVTPG
jgi:hypothetical protein